jgi:O-antigen/teichoic acid export membrane protein
LGAAQFGLIAQALSLAMVLSLFCTLGLEAACPKFLIGNIEQSDFKAARSFVYFNFLVTIAMSVIVVSAAFWVLGSTSPSTTIAILAAPIVALTRMAAGFSMGFSNVYAAVIPRSFLRPFLCLCLVASVVYQSTAAPIHWVLICFFLANFLVFVVQAVTLARPIAQLRRESGAQKVSFFDWRKWLGFGTVIGGAILFIEFFQHISILIASITLPASDIAYLDVCMKLVGFVTFGIVAVNQSYLPRNAQAFFGFETTKLQALLRQAAMIRCIASALGVAVIYFAGPSVLRLFGAEFSAAMPVLNVLLWLPFLIGFFGPAANMLSITDHPVVLLRIVTVALISLCVGVTLGGKFGGVIGVAYGVVFSWLVWGGLVALVTWRRLGVDTTFIALIINHRTNSRRRAT